MTQRDPGVYLEDIEYYANAAVRMSGYNLDQYLADEKTRADFCGGKMRIRYTLDSYETPQPPIPQ